MMKKYWNKIKSYVGYTSVSLSSTAIELGIFSVLTDIFEAELPLLYISAATLVSRIVSDGYKYIMDRYFVFHASGAIHVGTFKYIILAFSKMALSSLFVTILSLMILDMETIIKMFVDVTLFFPGFYIEKKWVHEVKD